MKKYLYSLMVVMFTAFSFALTSCGDDDDKDEPVVSDKGELVGTWKNVDELNSELGVIQYIQFNANGSYVEVNIYEYDDEVGVLKGNWISDGKTVTISGVDVVSITATIVSLSNSKLILNSLWDQEFVKVPDSEIEAYL